MKLKWSLSLPSTRLLTLPHSTHLPSGHEKMQTIFNFNWKVVACITLCTFSPPTSHFFTPLTLYLCSSLFLFLLRHS